MTKKVSNFTRYLVLFLVLMMCLTFLPTIQANAGTSVDLIGDSSTASSKTVKYGISYCQTGYLCYLLTADGNKVAGTSAYAFKCPGFYTIGAGGSPIFKASSRKGGYVVNSWKGVAPWNCSPFNSDKSTNAEAIRNWMKTPVGSMSQSWTFIKAYWGSECANKYATGDYILVIETILHFRYSFDYTFSKDYSVADWTNLVYAKFGHGMPESVAESAGRAYYKVAQKGESYRAPFCNSIIGTVRDCLDYYSVAKSVASTSNPYINVKDSNLFSRYLNNIACYAERIGSGGAGEKAGFAPWMGTAGTVLSTAQVKNYGVAMLVISALDDDLASTDVPLTPDTPDPSGYDGTVYTLSATGGSTSDSDRVGATTYFGTGGYGCLSGSFYAENCASGTDAYNLAESMSSGMSYEGDVPQVVFSGTSYDLSVESSLGIVAGMLTVDPSTFPYVDIHSSSTEKDYKSYLSSIKSGLYPTIDRVYNNGSKGTSTYDSRTMDCGDILGGTECSKTYSGNITVILTHENSNPDTAIGWEVDNPGRVGDSRGVINMTVSYPSELRTDFGKVLYNTNSLSDELYASSLLTLRHTDLWSAYKKSIVEYVSHLQKDGTLQKIWTEELNKAITAKENEEANKAYLAYKKSNPEPVAPTVVYKEVGMSDEEWLASERYLTYKKAYEAWQKAHDEWQSAVNAVKKAAKEKANREFDRAGWGYKNFNTNNGYNGSSVKLAKQIWVFKLYWCSPIMQKTYAVDDKIPINDGPSRSSRSPLFSKAYKVSFRYTMENRSDLSDSVLKRMITYLPLAYTGSEVSKTPYIGVSAGDVQYYIYNKKIDKTDFLLPDATSMDMR